MTGVTTGSPGEPFLPATTQDPEGFVCLDKVPDRAPTLLGIPKPEINGWMGAEGCERRSCPGDYTTAGYILVTTDVVLPKLWPDAQTTRLIKQTNGIPPNLSDRVYRPSCNDWCYLCNDLNELDPSCPRSGQLPYGGSFHCDFIWMLQENEPMQILNGELYPDDRECDFERDPLNLQHKCPIFDIYIRQGAQIPKIAQCTKQTTQNIQQSPLAALIGKLLPAGDRTFAQSQDDSIFRPRDNFILIGDTEWVLSHDPTVDRAGWSNGICAPRPKAEKYCTVQTDIRLPLTFKEVLIMLIVI